MKQAAIQNGNFYIGGKRQRIREVLDAHEIWVKWRDIDPETVDVVSWLGVVKGRCSPKSFATWAKRKVEPEEVQARLAMPSGERVRMSADERAPEPPQLEDLLKANPGLSKEKALEIIKEAGGQGQAMAGDLPRHPQ